MEVGAIEAQAAHHRHKLARKATGAEALLDDRDEVVVDKFTRSAADQQFVLTEAGIKMEKVKALELKAHGCTCRWVLQK